MATSKNFPFAYIHKKICKTDDAVISIQCKAIQYGLGCFSGIRGFWNSNKKNLYIFRLKDHFERFRESAKILGMQLEMDYKKFEKVIMELLKKNKVKEDVYIRPTLYSGSTQLTPRFDNEGDDVAIYMISLKEYFKAGEGLNVCVSSWRRFDDDVFSVKAKMTGAYSSSALAKTEAIKNGFDEPIFLNRDGKVCEASGANIFGIKDGVVWTPPPGSNILNGITRRSLLSLFEKIGIPVREENFDRSMLYTFDEAFLSGTAAKVAAIRSVDRRIIGNGKEGPLTKKVSDLYSKAATCELKGFEKWCTPTK
ncbi:branched-chain amino acid transaminase [Candidatus Peregrinibacteria bacterium]|nr:branched-chain amino acid transaminase [Candidatus Peregrinibacteria bacterium]